MRLTSILTLVIAVALLTRGAEAGPWNFIFFLSVASSSKLLHVLARCESWTSCNSNSNCAASTPICQLCMLGNYCGRCSGGDCPSGYACSSSGTCQQTYFPPPPSLPPPPLPPPGGCIKTTSLCDEDISGQTAYCQQSMGEPNSICWASAGSQYCYTPATCVLPGALAPPHPPRQLSTGLQVQVSGLPITYLPHADVGGMGASLSANNKLGTLDRKSVV